MAAKQLVLVLSEPTAGQEAEYNDYYENLHLEEVLGTTVLKSAQRFKLVDEAGEACPLPYLALYEAEVEDSTSIVENLNSTRPQRQQSDALNLKTGRVWVFDELGPRHEK